MTAPSKINGRTQEQRVRMCQSKQRWSDQRAAEAGALLSLEARPEVGKLWTYHCPICRGWHLTRSWQRGQEPITFGVAA